LAYYLIFHKNLRTSEGNIQEGRVPSLFRAILEGFPLGKMMIAKMDASNSVLTWISSGYGHFQGDCKNGRVKSLIWIYFNSLSALSW
jgi:hypothetical protein